MVAALTLVVPPSRPLIVPHSRPSNVPPHRRHCTPSSPSTTATAAAAALLPPRCRRRRRAVAKLPPTSRCRAAAAAAPPFVGWLLCCCPPSDFVIACRHVTIIVFHRLHRCRRAAAIVGVLLHVYTFVCIWAKTGEYLAGFLAFVDL
jgi:hypothetical protein